MKTTILFTIAQLKRIFRDPVTLIVLFAIPIMLLVLFGSFTKGTENLSLRVAVVNSSQTPFAKTFKEQVDKVDVFKQPDKSLTLDEAKTRMREDGIDGIVELPASFGTLQNEMPSGKVNVYFDQTDATTGDIISSIMNTVADATNQQITGMTPPITIERVSISGTGGRIFDSLFAMFTGMAIMMVGIFGVASVLASDKKLGILRRLRVTPLRPWQLMSATMFAFAVVGLLVVAAMTIISMTAFGMEMKGDWVLFSSLVILSLLLMLGFGLAIGGWARNSTQADIYGQIVFMISLAFSGLWFPRALLPEWLQNITAYLPLTPVVDGIRAIVIENASFISLASEFLIIATWTIVIFAIGAKTFRWES